ncbi:hypothetical protein BDF19DRAFT_446176 [Syncephalis fuscata]|nr:hypothetical protein BDF19DRAFT_446176 [Syncephalis fuscata]
MIHSIAVYIMLISSTLTHSLISLLFYILSLYVGIFYTYHILFKVLFICQWFLFLLTNAYNYTPDFKCNYTTAKQINYCNRCFKYLLQ